MKIKVLAVPTTIILAGFIAVSYIKPGFDEYLQKRELLAQAKENAAQAETVANNVTALNQELAAKKENVDFIKRYYPDNKDEGRIIDSLNFVTGQAGLLTSKIQIEAVAEEEGTQTFGIVEEQTLSADPAVPVTVDGSTTMAPVVTPYQAPKMQYYGVSLEALGGYTNIKDLLGKLVALDRLQKIDTFKIATNAEETASEAEGEAPPASNGTLVLSYRSELPYQALPIVVSSESIIGIPGLAQPTFDFSAIDSIKAGATLVPNVVLGTEGKGNPFE